MVLVIRRPTALACIAEAWRRRTTSKALRERCEAALRDLTIPMPFDERAFCAALAQQRGRSIPLLPLPLREMTSRDVLYGLVISKPAGDIVVYERDTSRAHQQQIVAHEASHLILDHQPVPLAQGESLSGIEELLDEGEVRHVLGRGTHATDEEHEAEVLASLILEQAAISGPLTDAAPDPETSDALARLTTFYLLKKGA